MSNKAGFAPFDLYQALIFNQNKISIQSMKDRLRDGQIVTQENLHKIKNPAERFFATLAIGLGFMVQRGSDISTTVPDKKRPGRTRTQTTKPDFEVSNGKRRLIVEVGDETHKSSHKKRQSAVIRAAGREHEYVQVDVKEINGKDGAEKLKRKLRFW